MKNIARSASRCKAPAGEQRCSLPPPKPRRTRSGHGCKRIFAIIAAALTCSAAAFAAPDGAFVQYGAARRTHSVTTGLVFDWNRSWAGGAVTGYWEVSLGAWLVDQSGERGRAWVGQFGVTPVLRYAFNGGAGPWFVEGGIGAHLISPPYDGNGRRFATVFNFGDHIAVGRFIGPRGELALRLQHFSNGGIRRPNPGENFVQLRWGWRFE